MKRTTKKILSVTMAVALLGSTAATAAPANVGVSMTDVQYRRDRDNDRRDYDRRGDRDWRGGNRDWRDNDWRDNGRRSWRRGDRFRGGYVVRDYGRYRLNRPPRGYHWVYANGDYLLIAVASGLIAQVILGGGGYGPGYGYNNGPGYGGGYGSNYGGGGSYGFGFYGGF